MPFLDSFKKKQNFDQKIKDHSNNLILQFNEYIKKGSTVQGDLEQIFRNFPDDKSFLSHLFTGYEQLYLLFKNYITLNHEIKTILMPESIWKEKTKETNKIKVEFEHEFDTLLLRVSRGVDEFGGICEICTKWYGDNDPYPKELISKLRTFRLPYIVDR